MDGVVVMVNDVYNELRSRGRKIYKKEIKMFLECLDKQDYKPMFSTDLYVNRGGAYCEMLEIVNRFRNVV